MCASLIREVVRPVRYVGAVGYCRTCRLIDTISIAARRGRSRIRDNSSWRHTFRSSPVSICSCYCLGAVQYHGSSESAACQDARRESSTRHSKIGSKAGWQKSTSEETSFCEEASCETTRCKEASCETTRCEEASCETTRCEATCSEEVVILRQRLKWRTGSIRASREA